MFRRDVSSAAPPRKQTDGGRRKCASNGLMHRSNRGLLGLCGEWPRGRYAGHERDEFPSPSSFNHLVGAGQDRGWNCEAEQLGGLDVDGKRDLGDLLYRQVGEFLAIEDATAWPSDSRMSPP